MNGLAGLSSYETDDQQLTYESKGSCVIIVACMAANEEFKIKDEDIFLATKTKLVYSLCSE